MPDIFHHIKIQASPERVYQAIVTAEGISNWWTRDVTLDTVVGGTGEFGFSGHQLITRVRIDELEPTERVRWTTLSSFRPEWLGTTITFDLREENGKSALSLAHRGFKEVDEGYAVTNTGWGYYLFSLKQYLEEGKGTPR